MSIIVVDATRNFDESGYHLSWSVASHSGIDPEIFVHRVETGVFEHVACVQDMIEYGVSPSHSSGFFRKATASITLSNYSDALQLKDTVVDQIDSLVEDFSEVVDNFIGSETTSHSF